MKTSLTARAAALIVSMLIALGSVDLLANYAYPGAPSVVLLASAAS